MCGNSDREQNWTPKAGTMEKEEYGARDPDIQMEDYGVRL